MDEQELISFAGNRACMTCAHFTYGVDAHCHTLVACGLRQGQLQQGDHLIKQCRHWSPTWQKAEGWASEPA